MNNSSVMAVVLSVSREDGDSEAGCSPPAPHRAGPHGVHQDQQDGPHLPGQERRCGLDVGLHSPHIHYAGLTL